MQTQGISCVYTICIFLFLQHSKHFIKNLLQVQFKSRLVKRLYKIEQSKKKKLVVYGQIRRLFFSVIPFGIHPEKAAQMSIAFCEK